MSNYLIILLNSVPIGSFNEIIKFLELNLKSSFYDRQNLIEFLNQILVSVNLCKNLWLV